MFSAFKKLTVKQENGRAVSPNNVQSMSTNLQKKFAKGCNYNMKIVIRGDKNTGKTCLLSRLQGKPFIEEYSSTEEIQVASINWSYKNTEDIVKVEVWDVVDVAKKRKKLTGLKMAPGEGEEFETGLDASFIDVYKGCHGAILVFDITKPWTWDYVKKTVSEIPGSIPVLILANFTDQSHHRQVTRLMVSDFVENVTREAEVRWGESSLRNGFGLKFLHRFFNVPFLALQRLSLLQQLEINTRDILATSQELDLYMESEEADYAEFSDKLTSRRREAAEATAPVPSASIIAGQPSNVVNPNQPQFTAPASTMTYSSKTLSSSEAKDNHSVSPGAAILQPGSVKSSTPPSKYDVDNFVPDDGDFDSFLDETDSARSKPSAIDNNVDSSDDDDSVNPMVAKFDDDEDDVEIDNYESSVTNVRDLTDDSDSENIPGNIQPSKGGKCDELNDFLNDNNLDNSVDSMHKDYESI